VGGNPGAADGVDLAERQPPKPPGRISVGEGLQEALKEGAGQGGGIEAGSRADQGGGEGVGACAEGGPEGGFGGCCQGVCGELIERAQPGEDQELGVNGMAARGQKKHLAEVRMERPAHGEVSNRAPEMRVEFRGRAIRHDAAEHAQQQRVAANMDEIAAGDPDGQGAFARGGLKAGNDVAAERRDLRRADWRGGGGCEAGGDLAGFLRGRDPADLGGGDPRAQFSFRESPMFHGQDRGVQFGEGHRLASEDQVGHGEGDVVALDESAVGCRDQIGRRAGQPS